MGGVLKAEDRELTLDEQIEVERRWLAYHEEQARKETEAMNHRRDRLDELLAQQMAEATANQFA